MNYHSIFLSVVLCTTAAQGSHISIPTEKFAWKIKQIEQWLLNISNSRDVSGDDIATIGLYVNTYPNINFNVQDHSGNTPLHLAAKKGNQQLIEILLKNNANVNAQNNKGNTPLMIAAARGFTPLVNLLLTYNADIEARNNDGETALLAAAREDKLPTVRTLLEHHADIAAVDNKGRSLQTYESGSLQKTIASYRNRLQKELKETFEETNVIPVLGDIIEEYALPKSPRTKKLPSPTNK